MREKLDKGTKIKFIDIEATVIEDNGGDTLTVEAEGVKQIWEWTFSGISCEVIKPEVKAQIPFKYKGTFDAINNLRGRITTVHYGKVCNPQKKFADQIGEIRKESKFQVRCGIDYENIAKVKAEHESGERERRGLPESMEKIETGVYHHKTKDTVYVGCAPVNNPNSIRVTKFFVDNKEVDLDDVVLDDKTLREVMLKKDWDSSLSDWVQLPIENIISLSGI